MRFIIDNQFGTMAVDDTLLKLWPPVLTSPARIAWNDTMGEVYDVDIGNTVGLSTAFTDPSPYQSQFNDFITAAAAMTPPLSLARAIAYKQKLVDAVYNSKRAALSVTGGVYAWMPYLVPPPANPTGANGVVPCNGWYQGSYPGGTLRAMQTFNGGLGVLNDGGTGAPSLVTTAVQACLNGNKYYWEIQMGEASTNTGGTEIGILASGTVINASNQSHAIGDLSAGWSWNGGGQKRHNNTNTSYQGTWVPPGGSTQNNASGFSYNSIIGVALDLVNDAIWFSQNGYWWGNGSALVPASEIVAGTLTHAAFTGLTGGTYYPSISAVGADDGSGNPSRYTLVGAPPFNFTPPTGFGPLSSHSWSASDPQLIDIMAGINSGSAQVSIAPLDTSGPLLASPINAQNILRSASALRAPITGAYNTISANLAACASIAAVTAFDITVGWP